MTTGKLRQEWNQTAELLAMLHNTSLGAREAYSRDDFHPFPPSRRQAVELSPEQVKANWAAFKGLVTAGKFC